MSITINQLPVPTSPADLRALAEILCDAVNSGSAVSFMAPLSIETAEAWWRKSIDSADANTIILVARNGDSLTREIVGTVQLHPCWAPNQPHRADIAKLIVHRRARGRGVAKQLMHAIEDEATSAGYTLLVLDTRRGCEAESLYKKLDWTIAGIIPNYAKNADGSGLHDTVIFYKELGVTK